MPAVPPLVYGIGGLVAAGGYLLGRRQGLGTPGRLNPSPQGPSLLGDYPSSNGGGGGVGYGASPVVNPADAEDPFAYIRTAPGSYYEGRSPIAGTSGGYKTTAGTLGTGTGATGVGGTGTGFGTGPFVGPPIGPPVP